MAEFKITKKLSDEISGVSSSGKLLNDGYESVSTDEIKTLDTAMSYVTQHKRIKEILDLYKALVEKDVNDMRKMVEEAESMDNAIASSHNT